MSGLIRILLALTLFMALLTGPLAVPLAAAAEGSALSLTLEAGFEGRAKSGYWVPVMATIVNSGPEWSGHLQFRLLADLGPNRQESIYQYPVVVPAGATKQVQLSMPVKTGAVPTVQLVAGEEVVAAAKPALEMTWEALVGVLGVEPADLSSLGGLSLGQQAVRLIRLTAQSMPGEPVLLQNLDALLLDRMAWAELPAPQQEAIQTWVEHGGKLLLAGGPEYARLEPLFPWLGIGQPVLVERSLADIGTAPLVQIDAPQWKVGHLQGEIPLVYSQGRGAGRIHLLAFDPALEPFASWAGLPEVMTKLLRTSGDRTLIPGATVGAMATRPDSVGVQALQEVPVKPVRSSNRLLIILGLYALVIGPVHLLLLRSLRRLGWALLTLPLLSLAGAGSAYAYMQANRAAEVSVVGFGVIEGQPGGRSLMVRSVTGFYQPPGSTHTAEVGGALLSAVPVQPVAYSGVPFKPSQGTSEITLGRSVQLGPLNDWVMRSVTAEGSLPVANTAQGDLLVDGQYLTGQVTNGLPFTLRDAVLVAGPNFQPLGDLAPGAAAAVSVVLPAVPSGIDSRVGGVAEAVSRLLDPGMIGPGGPTPEQMARIRRQQSSWLLSSLLPWAQSLDQPRLVLVGWVDSIGLPVRVDGEVVEPSGESLYVQRMAYDFSEGPFQLSADFVPVRAIDSTVGMNQPMQWGWGMAKGMSTTVEHTVPAELVKRVIDMQWQVPIMDKGSEGAGNPLAVSVYRWPDQTWVPFAFSTAAITLSAADGFLSEDGRVRVRLEKLNDTPMILGAPGLTIRGEGAVR